MENNLLNLAKSHFNDEVIISRLGANTGESDESIRRGLDIAIPSIFLGLQSQSSEGLAGILEQAKQHFSGIDFENITGSLFAQEPEDTHTASQLSDNSFLYTVFGNKLDAILASLSTFSGNSSGTIRHLLEAVLPAVFASLTENGSNWSISSIAEVLEINKSSFASALPGGLGLGTFGSAFAEADTPNLLTNDPGIVDTPTPADTYVPPIIEEEIPPVIPSAAPIVHTHEAIAKNTRGAGLWWILIPIILILIWFLFGREGSGTNNTTATDSVAATSTDVADTLLNSPTNPRH
ncbi:DUF937 domain-containing protein [Sphingobacterium olei]|uniref:DUF937 domain-containing protein n=1 Tax=Sphingobacterium olei TaxID=2571155 RepID=A0A4U0NG81_9SPHI|nr:DUF937 domain-containing protein [Sphingobacterium olei]TJZ53166.1 DUF937 domain-containing protein [Sphingobacterium olei]